MNDRPIELNEIRGCYALQTFIDQHYIHVVIYYVHLTMNERVCIVSA